MRLLHPNPGEVIDRQTILHIKAREGEKKKINIAPFIDECNQLQDYLDKAWLLLAPKTIQNDYDSHWKCLSNINNSLWDLEDKIRAMKTANDKSEDVVKTAFEIVEKNDLRAEYVKRINALFGVASQEKLHNL